MKNVRHWWIQKPISNNCPIGPRSAEFCEYQPTIVLQNCEWIKVWSSEDLSQHLGMGVTRWVEICQRLAKAEALLRDAQVSLTLTWPLEAERIEKYFSEQAKGGE